MCYGFVPVENPTSFVLKSPQKILHKIRPKYLVVFLLLYEHVRVRVVVFLLFFSGSCSQETSMCYEGARGFA